MAVDVRAEMGSVTMIYIPSFVKIGLGIQKLIGRIHRYTIQDGDSISLLRYEASVRS
jgi:hypothetical protein